MKERNTVQKHLILDAVRSGDHPTADKVYNSVKLTCASISRGTVYRNLRQMTGKGEILCIEMPNAPDRFDGNPQQHYHFTCRKCGKMYDMRAPYEPELLQIADSDFLVESYDLIFKGICHDCHFHSAF